MAQSRPFQAPALSTISDRPIYRVKKDASMFKPMNHGRRQQPANIRLNHNLTDIVRRSGIGKALEVTDTKALQKQDKDMLVADPCKGVRVNKTEGPKACYRKAVEKQKKQKVLKDRAAKRPQLREVLGAGLQSSLGVDHLIDRAIEQAGVKRARLTAQIARTKTRASRPQLGVDLLNNLDTELEKLQYLEQCWALFQVAVTRCRVLPELGITNNYEQRFSRYFEQGAGLPTFEVVELEKRRKFIRMRAKLAGEE